MYTTSTASRGGVGSRSSPLLGSSSQQQRPHSRSSRGGIIGHHDNGRQSSPPPPMTTLCEQEEAIRTRAVNSYKKFFKIISIEDDPFLDRMSLLACANQGLQPSDLAPVPYLDEFAEEFKRKKPISGSGSGNNINASAASNKSAKNNMSGVSRLSNSTNNKSRGGSNSTTVNAAASGAASPTSTVGGGGRRPKRDAFDPFVAASHPYANNKKKDDANTNNTNNDTVSSASASLNDTIGTASRTATTSPAAAAGGGNRGRIGDNSGDAFSSPISDGAVRNDAADNDEKNSEGDRSHDDDEEEAAQQRDFGGEDEEQRAREAEEEEEARRRLERREKLLQRLLSDPVLASAYQMKVQQQLINIKIATKERRTLIDMLMRGAEERLDHESLENAMMLKPKRRRQIIPPVLLTHEENSLHAQLTSQESQEDKQKRQHLLELRKAMLMGDAMVDESIGDAIPGGGGGGGGIDYEALDVEIENYVRDAEERRLLNDTNNNSTAVSRRNTSQHSQQRNGSIAALNASTATSNTTTTTATIKKNSNKNGRPTIRKGRHYSRDFIERDAIRTLLNIQSSSQESEAKFESDMALVAIKGQEHIEKIRKRHMNTMISEINKMQEREDLLEHLAEREAVWKEMNAERKRQLHEKVLAADLLRNEKMERHEAEAERIAEERKSRLQENIDRRDERLAIIDAQNEADRKRRIAEIDSAQQQNRERLAEREQEFEAKCLLQREETSAKIALHDARQENLTVRRNVMLATNAHEAAKRQEQAMERRETRGLGYAAALEETIAARDEEVTQRRDDYMKRKIAFYRQQNEETEMRTLEAEDRREQFEAFRGQWCEAIDEHRDEKVRHVEGQQRARDESFALKKEMTMLKEEAHLEALERLSRVNAYKQSVRKAVVDAQLAHNETRKKAAAHHREQLRLNRISMSHKQEIVQSSIKAMVNGNKFPTDRDELENVIDAMSPENRRKQHQIDNARRELRNAKTLRDRSLTSGGAESPIPSSSSFNASGGGASRGGDGGGGYASSPAAALPSSKFLAPLTATEHATTLTLKRYEADPNESLKSSQHLASPVDEIIKRIRRSR